jgi:hypothetical protein
MSLSMSSESDNNLSDGESNPNFTVSTPKLLIRRILFTNPVSRDLVD